MSEAATAPAVDVRFTEAAAKKVNALVARHGGTAGDYAFFPVESGDYKGTLMFRRSDFSVAGLIDSVL